MTIEFISSVLALIISGFTIPFLISRVRMMSLKYHSLNLEHYQKLRDICGNNANENLSLLLVALSGVTKATLEPKLIEWFLYTPGAYSYIKKFGKCKKYLSIDVSKNKFVWAEKYAVAKNRIKEKVSIFLLYTLCGTVGVMPIIYYKSFFSHLGLVPTIFALCGATVFLILATALLFSITIIDDAANLLKVELE